MRLKIDSKIGLGEMVAVIAIIFSLVNLFRSCSLQNKLADQDYILRANQYRPQLTVSNAPEINELYMVIDEIKKTKSGHQIEGYTYISFSLELKNIGNNKANILKYITVDTLSNNDRLRSNLFNENPNSEIIESTDRYMEILPGQTAQITLSRKIQCPIDNIINLHILLIYTNDFTGYVNIYHTYLWYKYELPKTTRVKNDMQIHNGLKISVPLEEVKFTSKNESSMIYDLEQSIKILNKYNNSK